MKIKVTVSLGMQDHEEIVEIPDEELNGLSRDERDEVCMEYAEQVMCERVECNWEEVE